MSVSINSCWSH